MQSVSITTLRRGVLDTTLCDTVCEWLATCRWFSPGTPIYSTNKTNWNIVESGVTPHTPKTYYNHSFFPLKPLVHLELIRLTYSSSSRKGLFCSDRSTTSKLRDYLSCWLSKCKQKRSTLTSLRKYGPISAGMVLGDSSTSGYSDLLHQ
jgi:hypothetical protein